MRAEVETKLLALKPLSRAGRRADGTACKICGRVAPFFDIVDFNKVAGEANCYTFGPAGLPVSYYRCDECGLLFTTFFDDWQPEDFRRFVYNADYALVDGEYAEIRPKRTAERMARLLSGFENPRILDYGSGSGVFAAAMATLGFDKVQEYDPFSHPARPVGPFDVILCNEVLEHSPDPLGTMRDMKSFLHDDGCIILGQSLQPADIQRVRANWWYCAPRNGHCTTFAARTLSAIAAKFDLLFHCGDSLVFRPHRASSAREIARRVRSPEPYLCVTLRVPSVVQAEGLHSIENGHGHPFRWTAKESQAWRVDVTADFPVTLQVRIPFLMEVEPGFASKSVITIGGKKASATIGEAAIVAEVTGVEPGATAIMLQTPEHKSPEDLRGAPDRRRLGLALAVDVS